MAKRFVGSLLWLFAVAWAFNYVSAYTGLPSWIGSAIAASVALFVGVDPGHVIWPAGARTDPAPIGGFVDSSAVLAGRM